MNSVKTLHSAAMEYYDLGKIARAKGHQDTYEDYIDKAYAIAMEAALRSQIEFKEDDPLKAIYLRSVSWLAFDAGHLEEARLWAEVALVIAPNEYEEASLNKLLSKVQKNKTSTSSTAFLLGLLSSFDFEKNKIFIKDSAKTTYQAITLPSSFFQRIIPFYIGKFVEVELSPMANNQNKLILKNIRLAA